MPIFRYITLAPIVEQRLVATSQAAWKMMTPDGGYAMFGDTYRTASANSKLPFPLHQAPGRAELEKTAAESINETLPTRRLWAKAMLAKLDHGQTLDTHANVLVHTIALGQNLRIVALNGEPVADFGRWMTAAFDDGVTFALGYSHDQGLYLPSERMLDEGGYEVDCYYEYGYPAQLAPGYESIFKSHLKHLANQGY